MLDLQRIQQTTWVAEIDFHDEIASTNDRALHLATTSRPRLPLLVVADRQTQGRGRGQNRWISGPGALTFTVVCDTQGIPNDLVPRISLTAGLAICLALETFDAQADLGLKWPNDVFLDGKKLAGILIERPSALPDQCVIGIGLNVANAIDDELSGIAVSLRKGLGREFDRTDVLVTCLQQLDQALSDLRVRPASLVSRWRQYDWLQGRNVTVDCYGGHVQGMACGIDDDGALRVDTDQGLQRCVGGVVTLDTNHHQKDQGSV